MLVFVSTPCLGQAQLAQTAPNASTSTSGAASMRATAIAAERAPVIDGRDEDAVWGSAPVITGFRVFEPKEDADPSFETQAKISYDADNLYIFVRMLDPHPDSIVSLLSRRDVKTSSDQIKVMIDSYHDRRSGYEFAVNPAGVKRDYATFDDAREDVSWDGVWDVATKNDSLGWVAEYRIPLSQLRYAPADTHTFGFGIWRDIERYRERSSWPLWSPQRSGISSQLGRLTGLQGITTDRRLEVTPYVVAKNQQRVRVPTGFSRESDVSIGGDLKLGITPNVTLDATVNPDFGQVEADPAVVNLTAFETFFSERRPFFVEGSGNFEFGLDCSDGD